MNYSMDVLKKEFEIQFPIPKEVYWNDEDGYESDCEWAVSVGASYNAKFEGFVAGFGFLLDESSSYRKNYLSVEQQIKCAVSPYKLEVLELRHRADAVRDMAIDECIALARQHPSPMWDLPLILERLKGKIDVRNCAQGLENLTKQSANDKAEIERLRGEVAGLRKDAERYRYVRNVGGFFDPGIQALVKCVNGEWDYDSAIDAAIAAKQ